MWTNKIFNINFAKIWKNTYHSFCLPHHIDLHYKILHYAIKTNEYIYKCSRDETNLSPYCDFCNITEDILHYMDTIPFILPKNYKQTIHTISTHTNNKLKW